MTVFVDTSALYTLLDRDEANHAAAARTFESLVSREDLVTHNYVVVEAAAVTQRRLGPGAARALLEEILPVIGLVWVGEAVHTAAVSAFLAALRRRASLVDWVTFEVMRRAGMRRAFAFDRDFASQGFETMP